MNKIALLLLAGTVALLTGSCSFFNSFADSRRELEKEAAKPIPTNVNPVQTQVDTPGDEFADLEFEDEPLQTIAGLIPATNPETRVRSSVRGRQDPFSVVSLKPSIEIEKEEVKASGNNRNTSNNRNRNVANNRPTSNNDDLLSPPQAAFEPTLARNVIVSGLYEAGGRTKLIVQAPEENTSRYVEVGQYLSNGQILVKSIDRNHFPTPLVVLEQSGVEVSKVIGESGAESNVSSLPPSPPRNTAMVSNISLN